jgi:hypothetical protein
MAALPIPDNYNLGLEKKKLGFGALHEPLGLCKLLMPLDLCHIDHREIFCVPIAVPTCLFKKAAELTP